MHERATALLGLHKLAEEAARAANAIPRAERLGYALHDLTRRVIEEPPEIGRRCRRGLADDRAGGAGKGLVRGWDWPVRVPEQVSAECETGWEVWIVAARAEGRWHLLECGMVYP